MLPRSQPHSNTIFAMAVMWIKVIAYDLPHVSSWLKDPCSQMLRCLIYSKPLMPYHISTYYESWTDMGYEATSQNVSGSFCATDILMVKQCLKPTLIQVWDTVPCSVPRFTCYSWMPVWIKCGQAQPHDYFPMTCVTSCMTMFHLQQQTNSQRLTDLSERSSCPQWLGIKVGTVLQPI